MSGGSRKSPRLAGFQLHHKDPLLLTCDVGLCPIVGRRCCWVGSVYVPQAEISTLSHRMQLTFHLDFHLDSYGSRPLPRQVSCFFFFFEAG